MTLLMTFIYFVIVLGIIVTAHELGHFLFAKLFGVGVYEFSIGMGPKLLKRQSKKSETLYTLRLIPLGGFCALAGEDIEDEKTTPKEKILDYKKWYQRFLVIIGGSLFNFVLAFLILFFVGLFNGAPETRSYVGELVEGFPAYDSGIEKGDLIIRVNEHKTYYWDDIIMLLELDNSSKAKEIEVIKPDGKHETYSVKPKKEVIDDITYYKVGIQNDTTKKYGFIPAVEYAFNKLVSLIKTMFVTLGGLFSGVISVSNLSGPVGIFSIVGNQAKLGLVSVLSLVAFLSINVGIINLLPFPPFDGGRAILLIIEGITRKRIPKKVEVIMMNVGFILMIGLLIFVTFNDILRFF